MTPEQVRALWTERVMRGMPPVIEVSEHCRAVAAKYGRFYQQHPVVYSWAGIAAFAVHRIGMALMLYDFEVFEGNVTKIMDDFRDPRGLEKTWNDLNHLRLANNAFFEDVGWTLEAYMDPEGGIDAIEKGLDGYAGHENLLEAFRKIDTGRRLLNLPSTHKAGLDLIWQGSLLIEYHGQVYSAQKFYDSCDVDFDLFMTVSTMMTFEAASFIFALWKLCWFDFYMWTLGLGKVIQTGSLPNLKRLDHRWYWIQKSVFPTWGKVVRDDASLHRNIAAIVRTGELGRATAARAGS